MKTHLLFAALVALAVSAPAQAQSPGVATILGGNGTLSCSGSASTFAVRLSATGSVAGKVVLTKLGTTTPEMIANYSSTSLNPTISTPVSVACNGRDAFSGLLRPTVGTYDGKGLVLSTYRLDYGEVTPP